MSNFNNYKLVTNLSDLIIDLFGYSCAHYNLSSKKEPQNKTNYFSNYIIRNMDNSNDIMG